MKPLMMLVRCPDVAGNPAVAITAIIEGGEWSREVIFVQVNDEWLKIVESLNDFIEGTADVDDPTFAPAEAKKPPMPIKLIQALNRMVFEAMPDLVIYDATDE